MNIIRSIWHFFVPKERTLIFTSFDENRYAKAKIQLINGGIVHRSRIISQGSGRGLLGRQASEYNIYVAKEDEYAACQLI